LTCVLWLGVIDVCVVACVIDVCVVAWGH